VLDLKTGETKSITKGPAQDLYPTWSADGKWIYFSRFDTDTNGDGIISFEDNGVINRVALEGQNLQAYPLTTDTFSAYQPMLTPSQILFLSNMNGTGNIWALPLEGQIPSKENGQAQMAVARLLASRIPQEDSLAVLAYYKVLENFENNEKLAAEAAYEIGKLYQRMGRRALAIGAYEKVVRDFGKSHPEKGLAPFDWRHFKGKTPGKRHPRILGENRS
jgi:tetratricopeptide (TPR) repeat protein